MGVFLVAGIVLFTSGLFLIGSRQHLFSHRFEVYADFASVSGLEEGANVRVAGLDAGEVVDIEVPKQSEGNYRVRMKLDRKMRPLVREDSVASIQTEGLVGNKYLEIDKGTAQTAECGGGCTLHTKEPFDFADLMEDARGLLKNTTETMGKAGNVAGKLDQSLGTFLKKDDNGQGGADRLNATVANAERAAANFADDAEALKRNFFLRGFFKNRGFYNLDEISPEDYRSSKFIKSKSAKREWLDAKALFSGPDGAETLTPAGKAQLDRTMAGFVQSLPNNPLMVEGYSNQGAPDKMYRVSQARAREVEKYLQSRFKLNPKYVGSIALGNSPPPDTGRDSMDGIALVLLP
jgi:outer membrane protein OmpA-like peptidoglycan-associated protein